MLQIQDTLDVTGRRAALDQLAGDLAVAAEDATRDPAAVIQLAWDLFGCLGTALETAADLRHRMHTLSISTRKAATT